jgi:hypothetical protein
LGSAPVGYQEGYDEDNSKPFVSLALGKIEGERLWQMVPLASMRRLGGPPVENQKGYAKDKKSLSGFALWRMEGD